MKSSVRPASLDAHWLNPAYLVPLVERSPASGRNGAILAKAEIAIRKPEMGYAQRLAEVKNRKTDSTR